MYTALNFLHYFFVCKELILTFVGPRGSWQSEYFFLHILLNSTLKLVFSLALGNPRSVEGYG